jgi:hypothetical protein
MGIEPTRDFVEPHTGFEDRERHQAALHLRESLLEYLEPCRAAIEGEPEPGRLEGQVFNAKTPGEIFTTPPE